MTSMQSDRYRIAIPQSVDGSGIGQTIAYELEQLGHQPFFFPLHERVPPEAQVVFLFGPFGKFLHIPQQFAGQKPGQRPALVYWNTEGLPDLRIPRPLVQAGAALRSWVGRWDGSDSPLLRRLSQTEPVSWLDRRFVRFRYVGDYLYAFRRGWVDVFADISAVYADYLSYFGLPAIAAPFGSSKPWYADLKLERDIDVLWMGKRASRRRSDALDRLRLELRARGRDIYMVDNVERPFVFDDARTELLNRTKITLNLLRTWYDENSLRLSLAAPNRSMIVSEPLLPHVPQYRAGVHYASAPMEKLADTIVYYLEHEAERQELVENAYQLTTTELTFGRSMQKIMDAVSALRHQAQESRSAAQAFPQRVPSAKRLGEQ
jgi:hypothetical protein